MNIAVDVAVDLNSEIGVDIVAAAVVHVEAVDVVHAIEAVDVAVWIEAEEGVAIVVPVSTP